jgi:hypothetical protein
MNDDKETLDPEDPMARLAQEATNQSTPEKTLADQKTRTTPKRKSFPNRSKAPAN